MFGEGWVLVDLRELKRRWKISRAFVSEEPKREFHFVRVCPEGIPEASDMLDVGRQRVNTSQIF